VKNREEQIGKKKKKKKKKRGKKAGPRCTKIYMHGFGDSQV
jgi:hypothetical protein